MGVFYERVARPLLFLQEPERAHEIGLASLRLLHALSPLCAWMQRINHAGGSRPVECFGLTFPNAVGLAAGMDKDARVWRAAAALGFGHAELGTVTARAQPGNEKPRVFRLPKERALINRMGFNNRGAEAVAQSLEKSGAGERRPIPLGINLGKSKAAPLDEAAEDYLISFRALAPFADYVAINVSSPNTPELRKLQGRARLAELLGALQEANAARTASLPLLVKISPDLTFRQVDELIETALEAGVAGLICCNTTTTRPGLPEGLERGGLSGRPLHRLAVNLVNYTYRATEGKLPIIGVGGVEDAVSAGRMFDVGASLVQLYTALVYRGPFVGREIARALAWRHRGAWL